MVEGNPSRSWSRRQLRAQLRVLLMPGSIPRRLALGQPARGERAQHAVAPFRLGHGGEITDQAAGGEQSPRPAPLLRIPVGTGRHAHPVQDGEPRRHRDLGGSPPDLAEPVLPGTGRGCDRTTCSIRPGSPGGKQGDDTVGHARHVGFGKPAGDRRRDQLRTRLFRKRRDDPRGQPRVDVAGRENIRRRTRLGDKPLHPRQRHHDKSSILAGLPEVRRTPPRGQTSPE